VVREIKDPETGRIIERRTPSVVLIEKPPPSPQIVKVNWEKARARLFGLKREIDAELKALEEARQLCLQLAEARDEVAKGEASLAALEAQRPTLDAYVYRCDADLKNASGEHARRVGDLQRHRQTRPGFFARLFLEGLVEGECAVGGSRGKCRESAAVHRTVAF
jgi:hypothetical protein